MMTAEEERSFYAEPANQVPAGPPVRPRRRLSEPVPVRFPETLLAEVRERAAADDRSVSSWIRQAVEHELRKNAREAQAHGLRLG
jgi:predicted HicB family RNase H-like nuclease